jgi:hypothetical protein
MTKILGFDVGIRNLAYCVVEMDNNNYSISDWGIINLDEDRKLCQFTLRTKNLCHKTATGSYFDNETQSEKYLCKTHQSKYTPTEFSLNTVSTNSGNCCANVLDDNTGTEKPCTKKSWV